MKASNPSAPVPPADKTTIALLEELVAEANTLCQKARLAFLAVREIVGTTPADAPHLDDLAALGVGLAELDLQASRHRLTVLKRLAEARQLRTLH